MKGKKTPKTPSKSKASSETAHRSQKSSAKVVEKTPEVPGPTTPEMVDKK